MVGINSEQQRTLQTLIQMTLCMKIIIWGGYVWKLYFGSFMKPKLQEGFVFGTEYALEVELAKVEAPSNPYTNLRFLNEENAYLVFDLFKVAVLSKLKYHQLSRVLKYTLDQMECK
jgi:hypothetical protein